MKQMIVQTVQFRTRGEKLPAQLSAASMATRKPLGCLTSDSRYFCSSWWLTLAARPRGSCFKYTRLGQQHSKVFRCTSELRKLSAIGLICSTALANCWALAMADRCTGALHAPALDESKLC
eukprot:1125-Heterococcus_DN1.PRE.4